MASNAQMALEGILYIIWRHLDFFINEAIQSSTVSWGWTPCVLACVLGFCLGLCPDLCLGWFLADLRAAEPEFKGTYTPACSRA